MRRRFVRRRQPVGEIRLRRINTQIEISKHYEKLPKPVAIAIQEFSEAGTYYRDPEVAPK